MDYATFISGVSDDPGGIEETDLESVRVVTDTALALIDDATMRGQYTRPPNQAIERIVASALGLGVRELRKLTAQQLSDTLARYVHTLKELGLDPSSVVFGLALVEMRQSIREQRPKRFKTLVEEALLRSVHQTPGATLATNRLLRFKKSSRRFDYVVEFEGEARLAVVVAYASWTGGRQKSDLEELPGLKRGLESRDTLLLAAVDGAAIRSMPGTMQQVVAGLDYLANETTLDSVAQRALQDASNLRPGQFSSRNQETTSGLDSIANELLLAGRTVTPDFLAISPEKTISFITRFTAKHSDYDLVASGTTLRASAADTLSLVATSSRGLSVDKARQLVEGLSNHLGLVLSDGSTKDGLSSFGLDLSEPRLRLPEPLPLLIRRVATYGPQFIETADDALGEGALVSRTGIIIDLIDPEFTRREALRMADLGRSQFAVLGPREIREILASRAERGRELLLDGLLSQVDLRVVSPFVPDGPTPASMFFGRERELRRVGEGIARQSFALVGGRKVGKTSLLRRLEQRLGATWPVVYVDCQAHSSREDFIDHLATSANLLANPGVRGAESVVRSFARAHFGERQGVLLMDEVDQLFWEDAHAPQHPHIVSAALRSLSQLRELSIIATGERQLFDLTKTAESPHWNFCTPIRVGALDEADAERLLRDPLGRLRIQMSDQALALALSRSARHPNLLQYLGDRLVSALAETNGATRDIVVEQDLIDSLTTSPSYRERFTNTFWSRATALEKLISVSSLEPRTPQQWLEVLCERGLQLDFSSVACAIDYLELYGVLQESADGMSWPSDSFDLYMGSLDDPLITDEWLREIQDAPN